MKDDSRPADGRRPDEGPGRASLPDDIARRNQRVWERLAREGCGFTRPWLELTSEQMQAYARGDVDCLPGPYSCLYPRQVFQEAQGRDILCLASGGGQQSAAFGLLGANVTVFDLTVAQLRGDRTAARHHGYCVRTVQGDMRDLSVFADSSFDLVYQEISLVFIPELRPVYEQVCRILRPGGRYRVAHGNPATQAMDETKWNGSGYVMDEPYRAGQLPTGPDSGLEFRHLFSEVFNDLIAAGFTVEGVWEDPRHLVHRPDEFRPGTWEHMGTYVQCEFAILALKPGSPAIRASRPADNP